MDKFDASIEHKNEVIELYNKINNKSAILNRCRPQSVASGCVIYYIRLKGKNIDIMEFKEKVRLSELTINRIAKEIDKIVNDNNFTEYIIPKKVKTKPPVVKGKRGRKPLEK